MNGTNGNEPGYPENALVPYPVIVVATSSSPTSHRPHTHRLHEAPVPLRTVAGLSAVFQCLRCHHSFHRPGSISYKAPTCSSSWRKR